MYRSPQPVPLTSDLEQHLVQMPLVARLRSASAQVGRVARAERVAPLPNGLVADDDPALGAEFLDVPKAEMKAEVEPDGVGDHLGRESVATVWGPWVSKPAEHGVSVSVAQLDNPPAQETCPHYP